MDDDQQLHLYLQCPMFFFDFLFPSTSFPGAGDTILVSSGAWHVGALRGGNGEAGWGLRFLLQST